jgi:Domain of unknown function (DUF4845)
MNVKPSSVPSRRQRGISLVGLLFWGIVIGFGALLSIKVIPAYMEYQNLNRLVTKLSREGGNSVPEIRSAFNRFKQVEYGIESITANDLEITKEDDRIVVSFAYDKEIELAGPVSLLIKFKGQSK